MTTEFDLPCADCGLELVESTARPETTAEPVTVAKCPGCGSRYYPEGSLGSF
jgi:DNA-directed RNA polymerase subunit RPC12/RpoP